LFASKSEHFPLRTRGGTFELIAPYWLYILLVAGLAAAPWIHWTKRFRLRTMLIATTLIALALGGMMLAVR
jgi:hypothetical protein